MDINLYYKVVQFPTENFIKNNFVPQTLEGHFLSLLFLEIPKGQKRHFQDVKYRTSHSKNHRYI